MSKETKHLKLFGYEATDGDQTFNLDKGLNENWEKIDGAVADASEMKTVGGTGTAITLSIPSLLAYKTNQKFTFIASANNSGASTTINVNGLGAKSLFKANTTTAPKLVAGKAYEVWYNGTSFFLKASAEGNAIAAEVLAGKTFSTDDDTGIVGSMINRGSVGTQNLTSEGAEYTIPQGYHNGLGKVKAVISGLIASVIKAGTTVGGIVGTFTADANASSNDVLSGKTAYVNGLKLTGSMANRGSVGIQNLTSEGAEYTIPQGYHNGLGKVKAVISGLIASVIKAGTTVGGIVGTFTADANASSSHLLSGKTAYVNGSKVTGTIPSKSASTITPGTANQAIAAGQYLSGAQTIVGDADLVASNIAKGKTIFGILGAHNTIDSITEGDSVVYDSGAIQISSQSTVELKPIFSKIVANSHGKIRIAFTLATQNSNYTVQGRVYKNGLPVGILRTTNKFDAIFVEDFDCNVGDEFQVHLKGIYDQSQYYTCLAFLKGLKVSVKETFNPVKIV